MTLRCLDSALRESTPLGQWDSAPPGFWSRRCVDSAQRLAVTRRRMSQHRWDSALQAFCATVWSLQSLNSAPPPGVGAAWTWRCLCQPWHLLDSAPLPQAGFCSSLTLLSRRDSAPPPGLWSILDSAPQPGVGAAWTRRSRLDSVLRGLGAT